MDDLISVLIVDDNAEFCNILNEYLNQCGGIIVNGIAKDGIEAIDKIKELTPEVVILDLIMPNLDGIGVLERISMLQLKHKPIFIVLSAIGQDIIIQKAMEFGADYYIMKPFDINMLVSRIRQHYNERVIEQRRHMTMSGNGAAEAPEAERGSLEQVVTDLIKNMGITPNIAGYRYLREVVILSVENSSSSNSITKFIYPSIANKHNITARNVDRSIRCAVESAFKKTQKANMNISNSFGSKNKPTNVQVIAMLVNKAMMEMKITK